MLRLFSGNNYLEHMKTHLMELSNMQVFIQIYTGKLKIKHQFFWVIKILTVLLIIMNIMIMLILLLLFFINNINFFKGMRIILYKLHWRVRIRMHLMFKWIL